jgi:hypothetical protein
MRATHHPIHHLVSLIATGLMLAGLLGGPALPAALAAGTEPFRYQNDSDAQHPYGFWPPWEPQAPLESRHDHLRRMELGYGLPDRYTIHKGKKCELQCTRIKGTRGYNCREYRC